MFWEETTSLPFDHFLSNVQNVPYIKTCATFEARNPYTSRVDFRHIKDRIMWKLLIYFLPRWTTECLWTPDNIRTSAIEPAQKFNQKILCSSCRIRRRREYACNCFTTSNCRWRTSGSTRGREVALQGHISNLTPSNYSLPFGINPLHCGVLTPNTCFTIVLTSLLPRDSHYTHTKSVKDATLENFHLGFHQLITWWED